MPGFWLWLLVGEYAFGMRGDVARVCVSRMASH